MISLSDGYLFQRFFSNENVYQLILTVYLGFIVLILLISWTPQLHQLVLYGKTAQDLKPSDSPKLVSWWLTITVPKLSFTHYYVSLAGYCALIAGLAPSQANTIADLFQLDDKYADAYRSVRLLYWLLCGHLLRRVLECLLVTKFLPDSKMNVAHYVLGMVHYMMLALQTYVSLVDLVPFRREECLELTWVEWVLVAVFVLASINQMWCHVHLALLVKYSIPQFWFTTSAHYTNEIELYVVFWVLSLKNAVPTPYIWVNYLAILAFVFTNLSVSLLQTLEYYRKRFGERLGLQYAIIPGFL